jgi:glycosyltransferase involved in cell wall biosynthesis
VVQAFFPDSSYFGILTAWLAGVKHRLRTRNNIGHWITPLHRRLGRLLNLFTTATLVNCQAARQAFLESEGGDPESICVLENGVNLERFRDIPPVEALPIRTAMHVGCVANLRPIKGLDDLIQAAARLKEQFPQTVFTVAGEGELKEALRGKVDRSGLADRFFFPGGVTDVPRFLAQLDVAVLCSHAEGMSNALLEYMAAGRPIVATTVGAAVELIEHGTHGLLVPPGDASRLADAIGRLMSDRPLAARLGEAARARAIRRFGRAAMVQRFENYYARLIHPQREV